MPNNVIMADPKNPYRLLASGTYTNETEGINPMIIPVSYSGTPKAVFVGAVNGDSLGGTYRWSLIYNVGDVTNGIWDEIKNGTISLLENQIDVRRVSTGNPIHAQDYKWLIYGE